jgi:hypothetical protein
MNWIDIAKKINVSIGVVLREARLAGINTKIIPKSQLPHAAARAKRAQPYPIPKHPILAKARAVLVMSPMTITEICKRAGKPHNATNTWHKLEPSIVAVDQLLRVVGFKLDVVRL